MTPDERAKFLKEHRLCVVAYERTGGPPALSPVYYVMDGDDILISTTASRAKAKALRRKAQVSICVLAEQMPFAYLTVYGRARIEEPGAADLMVRVGEKMSGNPVPEAARPAVEKRAADEGRVVLRVTPEGFVP
ncbi:MAG TPA: PPOX class F420-dependent oxidoreductase [Dehalococcoidia bacterium]